jgi:hypothetical protein
MRTRRFSVTKSVPSASIMMPEEKKVYKEMPVTLENFAERVRGAIWKIAKKHGNGVNFCDPQYFSDPEVVEKFWRFRKAWSILKFTRDNIQEALKSDLDLSKIIDEKLEFGKRYYSDPTKSFLNALYDTMSNEQYFIPDETVLSID